MDGVKPRVKVPKTAAAGDVVTIKTLISHPMESGQRKAQDGSLIPRQIINRFTCHFEDALVIDVAIDPAVATNPYFEFDAKVGGAGVFRFAWHDDDGSVYEDSQPISLA
ncbi:thiosulfate oxidation carrier complex protein SoxZ [Poseidonocella sp. HB161398]|uniref:thiosulfate oxidation carrier complex protein SoxZ n=1 Tax=Poseidonocella sp. HB161398 TaxID=2320855 RepID=UPI001109014C|nr:thiosulfate oxidation carrier complex protein SoxZ [Poseidonocella sp. HB161398]